MSERVIWSVDFSSGGQQRVFASHDEIEKIAERLAHARSAYYRKEISLLAWQTEEDK